MTKKSTERSDNDNKNHKQELLLSELVTISKEKIPTKSISPKQYISTENMNQDFLGITLLDELPKIEKITKFNKKDILISNIRPYLKKIWLSEFDGGCSSDIIVLHPNNLNDSKFIYYSLTTSKFINYMMKTSKGTKMPRGDKKAILKYKLINYEKNYKNNIINLVSLLDSKISFMERKLTLLNNIKKDFFNKIFSNDNKYDIKYNHVKFKELIKESKAGGTPKSTIKEYYGGNIPFLSINDMTSQGKYILSTEKYITEQGLNNSSTWLVPKNSLLYSMYASVGVVSINNIELTTSQAIYSIILKDNISLDYMYYYLSYYKKYVNKYIETGTQGNLNANIVKNLPVLIPQVNKQEKIGSFFSVIDNKIKLLKQEVIINKEFKKSLLNKMFC